MTDEEVIQHMIDDHIAEVDLSVPTEVLVENHRLFHSVVFTMGLMDHPIYCDHTHDDIEPMLLNVKFEDELGDFQP